MVGSLVPRLLSPSRTNPAADGRVGVAAERQKRHWLAPACLRDVHEDRLPKRSHARDAAPAVVLAQHACGQELLQRRVRRELVQTLRVQLKRPAICYESSRIELQRLMADCGSITSAVIPPSCAASFRPSFATTARTVALGGAAALTCGGGAPAAVAVGSSGRGEQGTGTDARESTMRRASRVVGGCASAKQPALIRLRSCRWPEAAVTLQLVRLLTSSGVGLCRGTCSVPCELRSAIFPRMLPVGHRSYAYGRCAARRDARLAARLTSPAARILPPIHVLCSPASVWWQPAGRHHRSTGKAHRGVQAARPPPGNGPRHHPAARTRARAGERGFVDLCYK